MFKLLLAVIATKWLVAGVDAQTSQCPGQPNTKPVWSGELTKVRGNENGTLYTAGDGDDKTYVIHVYGSAYQMGYTHGTLLKEEVSALLPAFLAYAESQIDQYIKFLPKKTREWIERIGMDAALDATDVMTRPFSPNYFYEEMRGLADATGLDYKTIVRIHMIPELIKASCSMLGAWGTSLSSPNGMLQLRALDFGDDSPLRNYPSVTIYHPTDGHAFANVGWAGWVSTIAGISSTQLAVSEKHSDIPFGAESRSGIPFNFLMRDILQFDDSLGAATRRIFNAHRTCSIWLGVGGGKEKAFRLYEYSESTAKVFDSLNVTKINQSRFTREHCDSPCYENYRAKDLLYWGIHLGCWNELLQKNHGQIDVAKIISMAGQVQTGDILSCVYDLENLKMYVSNARGETESGSLPAYDRQFVELDMKSLFAEPKPTAI